ncbi:amidase [Pyrenophora seminiperda CCB06]|uniref:Amidase n=1 Tax=Pyrenophora seminiperda CCB06 TaxID=1302712 RepID=A0A3M7MLD2_9PLEO|nr:amidase [Pyrenophora seminiperda CCB06]
MNSDFYRLTATDVLGKTKTGELSVEHHAASLLQRIALPAAERGPLHGIAVAVKHVILTIADSIVLRRVVDAGSLQGNAFDSESKLDCQVLIIERFRKCNRDFHFTLVKDRLQIFATYFPSGRTPFLYYLPVGCDGFFKESSDFLIAYLLTDLFGIGSHDINNILHAIGSLFESCWSQLGEVVSAIPTRGADLGSQVID